MPGLLFVPAPYFLVGPTAVGKTDIAVRAAELAGAEIVNADAFQAYAGLGRLTGQPSSGELARVRHHLVGHVPLAESYNVARYLEEASACLEDAAQRGRPVIVVGGSGLYVKSLTHGLSPLPPANPALRAEFEGTELSALVDRLEKLDPVAATTIDRRNRRRLVRAVEVCLVTGGRFSEQQTAWKGHRAPIHGMFLVREKAGLDKRINRRVGTLMADDSLEEVRQAWRSQLSDTASKIIGLAEIAAFLAGTLARDECLERIRTATRRYAKRQLTWFRGESFHETVELGTGVDPEECAKIITEKILARS